MFIVDYLLRWATADYKFGGNPVKAYLRYPFSFYAIVDLLSILPSVTVLNTGFKLFRLFLLNKAFKALKLLRYFKSFNLIMSVIRRERWALPAVFLLRALPAGWSGCSPPLWASPSLRCRRELSPPDIGASLSGPRKMGRGNQRK